MCPGHSGQFVNGAGVYFLAHAHLRYVVHAGVEFHFSSCDRMASQGSDRQDTSKHLYCAIGVPVAKVQLVPSLPRGARTSCHAPKLVLGEPYICYTALNTPGV